MKLYSCVTWIAKTFFKKSCVYSNAYCSEDKSGDKIRGQKLGQTQDISNILSCLHTIFINHKGKNDFVVGKSGQYHFKQAIKVNSIPDNERSPSWSTSTNALKKTISLP